jgi:2-phosphosulfolactate phosphatase
MLTALANGAVAIKPVAEIAEALSIRRQHPEALLAGERNGRHIRADLTGEIDFDLGNSPREFTPEKVQGRTIIMSTTNGTRALHACAGAKTVLISAFLNLQATARWLEQARPARLLFVCSGTLDQAAYEDALAAGELCRAVWPLYSSGQIADSALMAWQLCQTAPASLLEAIQPARNARRLSSIPDLAPDIAVCTQRDTLDFVAGLYPDGTVRIIDPDLA